MPKLAGYMVCLIKLAKLYLLWTVIDINVDPDFLSGSHIRAGSVHDDRNRKATTNK